MLPLDQDKIWQTRHKAQLEVIEELIVSCDAEAAKLWPHHIKTALKNLKWWSNEQFTFFLRGFFEEYYLVDSRNDPAAYALSRIIDQTAYDISVWQRACQQRLVVTASEQETSIHKALELGDKLAHKALQPAVEAGLLDAGTQAITYFQKEPNVRIMPYAPIALIGIPYTCIDSKNAQDYLAIAHEVGHYVFWNARKQVDGSGKTVNLRALIYSTLTRSTEWSPGWEEEIFADIYSTLVAGPIAALSMQKMLIDNLYFNEDDGQHPVPKIRPRTHLRVLEEYMTKGKFGDSTTGTRFPKAVKILSEYWQEMIKARGMQETIAVQIQAKPQNNPYVTNEKAIAHLHRVTDEILSLLHPGILQIVKREPWTTDINNAKEELYMQFKQMLDGVNQPTLPSVIDLPGIEANDQVKWFKHLQAIANFGITLDPSIWKPLLQTGWLSNGPEDVHGG